MFSMFRFLMGDKSVVCRIIRLLILILTIYVSYVLTHTIYFTPVHFDASQPRPTPATPRPLPGSPPVTYFIGLEDSVFLTQISLYS